MAAIPFETTLYEAFQCSTSGCRTNHDNICKLSTCYLEIPIKGDIFEVPVVATLPFINMTLTGTDNADAICVALYNTDKKAKYTTPDRNMRDILKADWKQNHLVCILIEQDNNVTKYYGGHGVLLGENRTIIAMLSWQIRRLKTTCDDGTLATKYQFVKPILRINPLCFKDSNPMLKWCANKLFKTGLSERVIAPYLSTMHHTFKLMDIESMTPSIVLEESPFNIRIPDVPDVLTTREDILQPIIDHIDELVQ